MPLLGLSSMRFSRQGMYSWIDIVTQKDVELLLRVPLGKDSPDPRPVQSVGRIVAVPEVGGLHHRYERRAA